MKEMEICPIFYGYKIAKAFSYCEKLQVVGSCLTSSYVTGVLNLNTFSVTPSIVNEIFKKVLFH
jgi:hypothetical protein